jgi:hypothetical protein
MKLTQLLFLLLLASCTPKTETQNPENSTAEEKTEAKAEPKKPEIKNPLLLKFKEIEVPFLIDRIRDWNDYDFRVQEKKGYYAEQLTDDEITKIFGAESIPDGPTNMVGLFSAFRYFYDEEHLVLVGKYMGSNFIVQMTDLEGKRIGKARVIEHENSEGRINSWYSIRLDKNKIIQEETKVYHGDDIDPKTQNLEIIKVVENVGKKEYGISSGGIGQ